MLDAFQALNLRPNVLHDVVGCRTVGGGECHIDIHRMVVLDVNLVDHAEIPHIDRHLGVVNGFENIYYLLFNFCFLFLVHRLLSYS